MSLKLFLGLLERDSAEILNTYQKALLWSANNVCWAQLPNLAML
jgi:hypothetical protein